RPGREHPAPAAGRRAAAAGAGGAGRAAAGVVRAGAAVVPGPAGAGEPALQHPGGAAAAGPAGRGSAAAGAGRGGAAARGAGVEGRAREGAALYGAFVSGRRPSRPELPVQYADYAAWQRRWLSGPVLEAELGYWREKLAGLPALELPADRPRPAAPSYRGAVEPVGLDEELTARLRELGRREGATLFMTLLAAFDVLLARHAGQREVVVGSHVADRPR